ncbi:MAG: 2'-5' RNA ligase [Cognaticolwellia sp.]
MTTKPCKNEAIYMYSIWLMPSDRELMRYQNIISEFSEHFNTPVFEPHITLFSGIENLTDEIIYQVSVLAALTDIFDVTFDDFGLKSNYYKSIYLKPDSNQTLEKMNQELQEIFSDISYSFKPHLSLLYSEISKKEKQDLLHQTTKIILGRFQATTLRIMKTDGEVKTWKAIEDFPLHSRNQTFLNLISEMVEKAVVYG